MNKLGPTADMVPASRTFQVNDENTLLEASVAVMAGPKPEHAICGARWTPAVNLIRIRCPSGRSFEMRVDRWGSRCPYCRTMIKTVRLRELYVQEGFCT